MSKILFLYPIFYLKGKIYILRIMLSISMPEDPNDEPKQYQCPFCEETKTPRGLRGHLSKHVNQGDIASEEEAGRIFNEMTGREVVAPAKPNEGGVPPPAEVEQAPSGGGTPMEVKPKPDQVPAPPTPEYAPIPDPEEQMKAEMAQVLSNELKGLPGLKDPKIPEYVVNRFENDPNLINDPNSLLFLIQQAAPIVKPEMLRWVVQQVFIVKKRYHLDSINASREYMMMQGQPGGLGTMPPFPGYEQSFNPYQQPATPQGGNPYGNMATNQPPAPVIQPPIAPDDSAVKELKDELSKLREEVARGKTEDKMEGLVEKLTQKSDEQIKTLQETHSKEVGELKAMVTKNENETKFDKLDKVVEGLAGHVGGMEGQFKQSLHKIEGIMVDHAHQDTLAQKDLEKRELERGHDTKLEELRKEIIDSQKPKKSFVEEVKDIKLMQKEMEDLFPDPSKGKDESTTDMLVKKVGNFVDEGQKFLFEGKNSERTPPETKQFTPLTPQASSIDVKQRAQLEVEREEREKAETKRLQEEAVRLEGEKAGLEEQIRVEQEKAPIKPTPPAAQTPEAPVVEPEPPLTPPTTPTAPVLGGKPSKGKKKGKAKTKAKPEEK